MNLEKALDERGYYEDDKVAIILKSVGLSYVSGVIVAKLGYVLGVLLQKYKPEEMPKKLQEFANSGMVEFEVYARITDDVIGYEMERKGEVLSDIKEVIEEYCKAVYEYSCKRIDEAMSHEALLEDMLVYAPSEFEGDFDIWDELDDLEDEF